MGSDSKISSAVIKRLPRYYRYLEDLLLHDISRISSKELSARMGITASQIRQDLNNFGCFGQQGYGYNVISLHAELKKILGLDKTYHLIIIGAGNLGRALVNYPKFQTLGFQFIGLFDVNPDLVGRLVNGLEICHVDTLADFLSENEVHIAVLALPKDNAAKAVQVLVRGGVKGIWNFSHVDLHVPKEIQVENVHLTDSLMTLSYQLSEADNR